MANTTNLNLKKPLGTEQALIADINSNMDKIDAFAGTTNNNISDMGNSVYGLAYSKMTEITSNTNLNTYTSPGSYICKTAAIAGTLVNSPVTDGGFNLHVESVGGGIGQNIIQTVKRFSSSGIARIFIRQYNSTTWNNWEELVVKSEIAYDWNSFTNYVSSLETGANAFITRFGKMRSISFQGVTRTHTEDEVLATLPEADRPTAGAILTSGNVGSSSVVIRIAKDGKITLYALNGATASARVYFGVTYAVG